MNPFAKKQEADLEVFTIFDSKVGNYRLPMTAINKFDIIRQCESLFEDQQQVTNQLVTNAEDFAIFKIGEYDRKTGRLNESNHEHICDLKDLKVAVMRKKTQDPGIAST